MANVTDNGYKKAAELASAAMAAVATINTAAATAIAFRQLALANKYYDLAKEMRSYWNSTFRPNEIKQVNEAFNEPRYTPQYDVVAGRYLASVKQQFQKTMDKVATSARRYCCGMTAAMMRDIAVAQAMAESDAINLAYRYEDARKQIFDDRRWDRRQAAVALGRDLLSHVNSYMSNASNTYSAPRDYLQGMANSMMESWNTNWQLKGTRYEQGKGDYRNTAMINGRWYDTSLVQGQTFNAVSSMPQGLIASHQSSRNLLPNAVANQRIAAGQLPQFEGAQWDVFHHTT